MNNVLNVKETDWSPELRVSTAPCLVELTVEGVDEAARQLRAVEVNDLKNDIDILDVKLPSPKFLGTFSSLFDMMAVQDQKEK